MEDIIDGIIIPLPVKTRAKCSQGDPTSGFSTNWELGFWAIARSYKHLCYYIHNKQLWSTWYLMLSHTAFNDGSCWFLLGHMFPVLPGEDIDSHPIWHSCSPSSLPLPYFFKHKHAHVFSHLSSLQSALLTKCKCILLLISLELGSLINLLKNKRLKKTYPLPLRRQKFHIFLFY